MTQRFSILLAGLLLVSAGIGFAQDAGSTKAAQAYAEILSAWKGHLGQLRALREKYKQAEVADLEQIKSDYEAQLEAAQQLVPALRDAAVAAFQAAANEDRQLVRFLAGMLKDDVAQDRFEDAFALGQVLVQGDCDEKTVFDAAGMAAFATNHFDEADAYWAQASQYGVLDAKHQDFRGAIADYKKYYAEEQEILKREAEANDLPRVELATTQGTIVLELFENEAPDTVGNFVSLVEKGYYDGLTFHRVLPGFMAQGGCPKGDGTGGPGYNIYCECQKPDYRKHFRGSLSMAKTQRRDTGGSQFFLTFLPTPQLNGEHTVFGRVLDGLEVLAKFQRRDPSDAEQQTLEPDKILKAKMLRKREHVYAPTKVQ